MRLLAKGYGIQPPEWHVDEPVAAGYSRVYYIESGEAFFKEGVHTIKLPVRSLHIFPASTPYMLFHNVNAPLFYKTVEILKIYMYNKNIRKGE